MKFMNGLYLGLLFSFSLSPAFAGMKPVQDTEMHRVVGIVDKEKKGELFLTTETVTFVFKGEGLRNRNPGTSKFKKKSPQVFSYAAADLIRLEPATQNQKGSLR